jgi:hypothetical protein
MSNMVSSERYFINIENFEIIYNIDTSNDYYFVNKCFEEKNSNKIGNAVKKFMGYYLYELDKGNNKFIKIKLNNN